jgi:hypothetical protein
MDLSNGKSDWASWRERTAAEAAIGPVRGAALGEAHGRASASQLKVKAKVA